MSARDRARQSNQQRHDFPGNRYTAARRAWGNTASLRSARLSIRCARPWCQNRQS